VVGDDFDLVRITISPCKADPPLVIDADRMLAATVTLQGFQPIAGRDTQVVKTSSVVEETQFSQCPSLYIRRKPSTASRPAQIVAASASRKLTIMRDML
jgi:hypothetical protein